MSYKREQLDVPIDVKIAYEKLNTPEFRKYARKMSWLSQCLDFGEAFYGVYRVSGSVEDSIVKPPIV